MIALAIVGAVLGLLAIVLLCPIGVGLFYHDDLEVILYFGVFGKKVYPRRKKKSVKKSLQNKDEKPVKNKKKHKFSVEDILKIADCLLDSLKKIIRSLRVKKLRAEIKVSSDDAAEAALNYGKICSAVSVGYAALDKVLNEQNTNISVDLEYNAQSRVQVDFIVNAMLLKLIIIAVKALIVIMPYVYDNKKGGAKNERN